MAASEGRPGIAADSSAAGLSAQLAEVWDSLSALGSSLSDDDWQRATPCPGWPISAQFAHMIGTESMLLGRANPEVDPGKPAHVRNDIGGFNEVWVASLSHLARDVVLEQFVEVTSARKAALEAMTEEDFSAESWTPVGKADYRRFMQIRVFDCWVHEQDVRDGAGRPGHESGPVAEQSVDEIVRAIGYIVGKKAGLPADASVRFELSGPVERVIDVAYTNGRAGAVAALPSAPTTELRLSSNAFTRLACGRVSAEAVIDGEFGGVATSGDEEMAGRVVANLAFTI